MDHAQGQNTTWTAGTGDFENNSNWRNGNPANGAWFINNGGTAQKSDGFFTFVDNGYLGYNATESGNLQILTAGSSGTLNLSGNVSFSTPVITVAQEAGSTGVLNVTGPILATTEIVAGNGAATVNLNDGTTLKTA